MTLIRRYSALLLAVAAWAPVVSACGGNSSSGAAPPTGGSTSAPTVSLRMIAGLGQVLVDSSGDALYSPDQEAGGKVLCTGSCASIWLPLTLPASAGKPTATDALASKLGVVKRPDGANQVTFAGKPLYRFVEDSGPGEVSGNGLADSFDGKKFTWHVAGEGGASSSSAGSRSGYGS